MVSLVNGLALWACLATCCEAHKVIVFNPLVAHSHASFMGRIADELVDAGMDVVRSFVTQTSVDCSNPESSKTSRQSRKTSGKLQTSLVSAFSATVPDGSAKSKKIRVEPDADTRLTYVRRATENKPHRVRYEAWMNSHDSFFDSPYLDYAGIQMVRFPLSMINGKRECFPAFGPLHGHPNAAV